MLERAKTEYFLGVVVKRYYGMRHEKKKNGHCCVMKYYVILVIKFYCKVYVSDKFYRHLFENVHV